MTVVLSVTDTVGGRVELSPTFEVVAVKVATSTVPTAAPGGEATWTSRRTLSPARDRRHRR
jgi:hypothetical protein